MWPHERSVSAFEDFVSGSILILKRFKAITLKDLERLVCGEIIGS
jgi:hypothetical protein